MRRSRAHAARCSRTLALVLAVVWAFPVYWMLNSAFLPNVVLQSTTPTFLPVRRVARQLRAVARPTRRSASALTHLARRRPSLTVVAALADRLPRRAGDQPVPLPRPRARSCWPCC